MFKLIRITPIGGDETAGYRAELDESYTAQQLLTEILSKDEWGYITFKFAMRSISGKYTNSKTTLILPNSIGQKEVVSVTAFGGWSRMDYIITLK